jgi:hypothetical protein
MGDRSKAAQHRCGQLGASCAICGIDKPALRGMSAGDLPLGSCRERQLRRAECVCR